MSNQPRRPYSEEEMGYIADSMDRPRREVAAHLNCTPHRVTDMRRIVRDGAPRQSIQTMWTEDEDRVLLEMASASNAAISKALIGRTTKAVSRRRERLSLSAPREGVAFFVGSRTLLAKTCPDCGLLLPASWFHWSEPNKCWRTYCRKCFTPRNRAYKRKSDKVTTSNKAYSRAYAQKAQQITLPLADRKGEEFTESDHVILADESMTALGKALKMKRTYSSAKNAVYNFGYKSLTPLGDPAQDQWIIDNPNADRIEEITAMLAKTEPTTPTRPDFEWDD